MAEIISLDQRRKMKERIKVAKRMGQMQLTTPEAFKLLREYHPALESDSEADKLIKLALNTVRANRNKTENELLGEGYTDGMDE